MKSLTGLGLNLSDPLAIVNRVHNDLNRDPPFDATDAGVQQPWISDWRLMAGLPFAGECDEEAKFMKRALELLGVPGGTPYLTWPSLDCDPTEQTIRTAAQAGIDWDIDGDGQIGEEMLVLRFDFDGGAGTNINAFEGSLAFPTLGWYYAVWPSLKAQSKCELLLEVEIHPLYTNPNADKVIQCWALTDSPWDCIINPSTGNIKLEPFPTCVTGCP